MTKEVLTLALEALETAWYHVGTFCPTDEAIDLYDEARAAIKEALAQQEQDGQCKYCTDGCPACDARKLLEQEPVAWGVFEGNLHDMFFTEAEAVEMARLKGTHAEVKPLYTKEST